MTFPKKESLISSYVDRKTDQKQMTSQIDNKRTDRQKD